MWENVVWEETKFVPWEGRPDIILGATVAGGVGYPAKVVVLLLRDGRLVELVPDCRGGEPIIDIRIRKEERNMLKEVALAGGIDKSPAPVV